MNKKDIEGALNELLGLDVHWSELPREDLEALMVFFGDDKRVFDTLGKEMVKERVGNRVDNIFKRVDAYRKSGKSGGVLKEILGGR